MWLTRPQGRTRGKPKLGTARTGLRLPKPTSLRAVDYTCTGCSDFPTRDHDSPPVHASTRHLSTGTAEKALVNPKHPNCRMHPISPSVSWYAKAGGDPLNGAMFSQTAGRSPGSPNR